MSSAIFWIITIFKYIVADFFAERMVMMLIKSGSIAVFNVPENDRSAAYKALFFTIIMIALFFIATWYVMTFILFMFVRGYKEAHFENTGITFSKISAIRLLDNIDEKRCEVEIRYENGYSRVKTVKRSWLEKHQDLVEKYK